MQFGDGSNTTKSAGIANIDKTFGGTGIDTITLGRLLCRLVLCLWLKREIWTLYLSRISVMSHRVLYTGGTSICFTMVI